MMIIIMIMIMIMITRIIIFIIEFYPQLLHSNYNNLFLIQL